MHDNETVVRDFLAAWSRLDVDELVGYFTEDGIYHNMPIAPVQGHSGLRAFITAFLDGWSATDWEILNLACAGQTVFAERIDRTRANGRDIALPCCGVFEMEQGKIKVWRDYFDMATYRNAAQGKG